MLKLDKAMLKHYLPHKNPIRLGDAAGEGVFFHHIDFGTLDTKGFEKVELGKQLREKIEPWIGLTGVDAVNKFHKKELTLTDNQAQELKDALQIPDSAQLLQERFNQDSKIKLEELPMQIQTAAAILVRKYPNPMTQIPELWNYLKMCQWDEFYRGWCETVDKELKAYPFRAIIQIKYSE